MLHLELSQPFFTIIGLLLAEGEVDEFAVTILGRGEGDALPCDELGALFERVSVPGGLDVTLR